MLSRFLLPFRILHARPLPPSGKEGVSRVEWIIGGSPLWFECADTTLDPGPEAFACVSHAACALKGWRMLFPHRVSPPLAKGLRRIGRIWRKWWKLPPIAFHAFSADPRLSTPDTTRTTGTFLSLGVDSFYTLLKNPDIRAIIYVAGYDVRLHDTARIADVEASLRDIGTRGNFRVFFVRTNLREHPVFRKLNWTKFHGAALAAVAHLLSGQLDRVMISASYPRSFFNPWGSSFKTDPQWSSGRMAIVHYGEDYWRFEKLEQIADHPFLKDHLRVCWEHRNTRVNCGLCEKCVRTMLGLVSHGKLEGYRTFPGGEEALLTGIRGIRRISPHLLPTYKNILKHGLPVPLRREVRRLLDKGKAEAAATTKRN